MVRGKPFKTNLNRLIKAGVVPKPIWLDIVEATRPPFEPVRSTQTKKIVYPEDKLRSKYLLRNPDARKIPVNLKAERVEDRHISDRFVRTQLRFMEEENMSEDSAYTAAEELINLRTLKESDLLENELSAPLTNSAIQDKAAQLYIASVRDSNRDKKLHNEIQNQTNLSDS